MERAVEMVTIGKIVRVHGLCGEVRVLSMSDAPRRFEDLKQVTVADPAGGERDLAVRACRRVAGGYLLTFEGFGTLEAAAQLVGGLIQVPRGPRAPLSDGQYYECDLVGMAVRTEAGDALGMIADILPTGSNAVFVVRGEKGGEHLIPGTKEVVRTVDLAGGVMTIRPIPGLLEVKST
jgi:16S rRNA processing protein RimM